MNNNKKIIISACVLVLYVFVFIRPITVKAAEPSLLPLDWAVYNAADGFYYVKDTITNSANTLQVWTAAGGTATIGAGYVGTSAAVSAGASSVATAAGTAASTILWPVLILGGVIAGGSYMMKRAKDSVAANAIIAPENIAALSQRLVDLHAKGIIPADLIQTNDVGDVIMTAELKSFLKTLVATNLAGPINYPTTDPNLSANMPIHRLPYIYSPDYFYENVAPLHSSTYNGDAMKYYTASVIPGTDYLLYTHAAYPIRTITAPAANWGVPAVADGYRIFHNGRHFTHGGLTGPRYMTLYNYKTNKIVDFVELGSLFTTAASSFLYPIEGVGTLKIDKVSKNSATYETHFTSRFLYDDYSMTDYDYQKSLFTFAGDYSQDISSYSNTRVVELDHVITPEVATDFGSYLDTIPDNSTVSLNDDEPFLDENGEVNKKALVIAPPLPDGSPDPNPNPDAVGDAAMQIGIEQPMSLMERVRELIVPDAFPNTFARLGGMKEWYRETGGVRPPRIIIPMGSILRSTSLPFSDAAMRGYIDETFVDEHGNQVDDMLAFDFATFDEIYITGKYDGSFVGEMSDAEGESATSYSILDYFRLLMSFGIIFMTFRRIWNKITPDKVI